MTSRTHTHKTINLRCWPSTPRPDAMSTKTMNLRRCWFGSPFSIGVDDISPLKTMNLWRCWPPSTPQKTINLRHWWFPSAFPAALLTLPPPTPHPPQKNQPAALLAYLQCHIQKNNQSAALGSGVGKVSSFDAAPLPKNTFGIAGLQYATSKTTSNLRCCWFGSAFPTLATFCPLTRPQHKTINLQCCWPPSMSRPKTIHLRRRWFASASQWHC